MLSPEQADACAGQLEIAQLWQAGVMVKPASAGPALHWLEVHAHAVPPQEPPVGPLDPPRQHRPAHQPHDERRVHAPQSVASAHSSGPLPVSVGPVVPASGVAAPASRGEATHAT
jgi:hypothetical protein